ncbi:hypothetical protein AVEN_138881-1 [Araneus ventricosus]|uniref:Uncharacterized protein n=1 Tax=Araneus ventricosus TaxID=182803 RepID=A0A4Y2TPS3_ARAVE|nr:hypothetical protein AVEN_138881-1 [Araneus ventricosus]
MDMRRRDLLYAIRRCVMAQPPRETAFSCRFDRSCCSASRKPNRLNGEWSEMPARGNSFYCPSSSLSNGGNFQNPKIDGSFHRGRLVSGRVNFPIPSELDASEKRKVSDAQVYASHTASAESISEVIATRIDSENF